MGFNPNAAANETFIFMASSVKTTVVCFGLGINYQNYKKFICSQVFVL